MATEAADVEVNSNRTEEGTDNASVNELFSAVRYGLKTQVMRILEKAPALANSTDEQGYTTIHWAAKKGDVDMLRTLHSFGASLDIPTSFDARMLPIHWAASDGKIGAINFLLEKRQDINAQDANGCTPVVIAAQHNQVDCVVFLIKNGADTSLRDCNGDSALHWASYKGHAELVGLLTYLMSSDVDSDDSFGQTALHLASLRGNHEVVEYLLTHCRADSSKKDRNGLNPLELSMKKSQLKTEWTLRKLLSKNFFLLLSGLTKDRFKDSRIIGYLICGADEEELSRWPWRIVFVSNLIGSLVTVVMAMHESMSDLYPLHLVNTMVQLVWWIMFCMCLWKSPAFVRDAAAAAAVTNSNTTTAATAAANKDMSSSSSSSAADDYSYAASLDLIGRTNGEQTLPIVCHTCRVRRPLRSKHCKILKKCVHKFDHFCPFVGNTVGRDNYKYFIGLLLTHMVAGVLWEVTACFLLRRVRISWLMTLYMGYSGVWMLVIMGLLNYHATLITRNLTTNEQLNAAKYAYLKNDQKMFDNPFDLGNPRANVLDGLFPSSKSYFSREEVLRDRFFSGRGGGRGERERDANNNNSNSQESEQLLV